MRPRLPALASMGILALAGGLMSALTCGPALADSAPGSDSITAVQELSMTALGIGSQTVHGRVGTVHIMFPAPAAPVAETGSFVRIFFAHSPITQPPAGIQVGVNGTALTTINLDAGTAQGGVFEVSVPGHTFNKSGANELTVQFSLSVAQAPSSANAKLYATLDPRTLLHYQLAGPAPGKVWSLGVYPYTLLSDSMQPRPRVGLVLPSAPGDAEIAAGLRLMADLGRRAAPRPLNPDVITSQQERWLAGSDKPAVIIGRIDRLPGVAGRLRAAGLTSSGSGWRAPGSTSLIAPGSGILVAGTDNGHPSVVVTGATDAAVQKAAAALLDRVAMFSGPVAVVTSTPPATAAPARTLSLGTVLGDHLSLQGSGEHILAFGIGAPAVDPAGTALLACQMTSSGAGLGTPSVMVAVGGRRFASQQLNPLTDLTVSIPGSSLKPGPVGIALDLSLGDIGLGDPATQYTSIDIASAASTLALPPAPPSLSGLGVLPFPFLDGSGGDELIVLTDRGATGIRAAATTMAALGSHSIGQPAPIGVTSLERIANRPVQNRSLIVVGAPRSQDAVNAYLRLDLGSAGSVVIGPPGDDLGGRAVGWVRAAAVPDQGINVLWIGGRDVAGTAQAAQALYDNGLRGNGAVVQSNGSGHVWEIASPTVTPSVLMALANLLPLLPVALLVAVLVVLIPRRLVPAWRR